MKAETAYNVIQALPEKEYKRLLIMLGVKVKVKKVKKHKSGMTDAELTEYVLARLNKKKKNRKCRDLTALEALK